MNKLWLNGYLALVKDGSIDFVIDNDGNEHPCPLVLNIACAYFH